MSEVTLEAVQAKQTELAQLIEKLQRQSKATTLSLVATQISLLPGERYVGPILKEDGAVDYHLVFVAIKTEEMNHGQAVAWPKTVDAKIANKREIRLVQANAPDLLPTSGWCWLEEENGSSYAWICHFNYGSFFYLGRSSKGAAVAVRRVLP